MNIRQTIWEVIREYKVVHQPLLMMMVKPKPDDTGHVCIGRYLYRLYCVGILDRKRNRRGIWQYTLVKDLGLQAPIARAHEVYDPNDGCFLDIIAERVDEQLADIRSKRSGMQAVKHG